LRLKTNKIQIFIYFCRLQSNKLVILQSFAFLCADVSAVLSETTGLRKT